MSCKRFWCTVLGHSWGDKVRIELDLPAFGRGFVIHEACERCGKERTSLDFKVNKTNFKQNSSALLPVVPTEAPDAQEKIMHHRNKGDYVRYIDSPADKIAAPKKARAKKPPKSNKV